MPLQLGADGAHSFIPPIGRPNADIGELTSPTPTVNGKEPSPIEQIHYMTLDDAAHPDEGIWWMTIRGSNNGYKQQGPQELVGASISEGELDLTAPQEPTLPLKLTAQATPDAAGGSWWRLSHALGFGKEAMNITSATQSYLFGETSDTDPTVAAKTYVTTQTSGMATVYFAGVQYLALLILANPMFLLSDYGAVPTPVGAMDALTIGAEAAITTPLGNTLIWTEVGNVLDIPNGAAYNSVPNIVQTNVLGIAGLIGLGSVAGRQARVYLLGQRTPIAGFFGFSSSTSTLDYGPWDGQIESFDVAGGDRQVFDIGLDRIRGGDFYREGMVAHDGRTMRFRGRVDRTLNIMGGRKQNSDRETWIGGFYVRKRNDLFIVMNEIAASGGSGNTKMWIEAYDWNSDSCTPITKKVTIAGTGIQTYACCRSLPISPQTTYFHQRVGPNTGTLGADGSWYRYRRPAPGQTSYDQRQTSGAGASTGWPYDALANDGVSNPSATLPELWAPGNLYHARKTTTGAYFGGKLENSEEVWIAIGGRTFKFIAPAVGPINERSRFDTGDMTGPDSSSEFLHAQPVLTLKQGTGGANTTPQPYPITLWGRWYGPNSKNGWNT